MILAKYKIEYENGFVQYKNLIKNEDYESIIKPLKNILEDLKIKKYKTKGIKSRLNELHGEDFFTTGSRLHKAIKTGVLELLPQQEDKHKIKIIKV